jgi:RimK family alpha-L-glutamate ligase
MKPERRTGMLEHQSAEQAEADPPYRIGVVTPDPARDPTSAAILAAAHPHARVATVNAGSLHLHVRGALCWSAGSGAGLAFDALILRRLDADRSHDVQFELLELLERAGVLLINRPGALALAESKLLTTALLSEAGVPVPETVLAQTSAEAHEAVETFGEAVLKPVYGALGTDVERVDTRITLPDLDERLDKHGALYVQEYIPGGESDIRAFVVGERVIGAMRRVPAPGEWRANIHRGGKGVPVRLSPAVQRLAVRATQVLGLDYAGVDLIQGPRGPYVIELNGAPGWHGLEAATGCDVPAALIGHVVARLQAGRMLQKRAA